MSDLPIPRPTTPSERTNAVRDYARACNGSERFHRHGMARRMLYTDGVKFVAETCGAYWLIDVVASYIATTRKVQLEDCQVWTLEAVGETAAVVRCTNGNDNAKIVEQEIPFTDFPRDLMPFRFLCERCEIAPETIGFVLMLPEER